MNLTHGMQENRARQVVLRQDDVLGGISGAVLGALPTGNAGVVRFEGGVGTLGRSSRGRGFTLIELLMVVSIISLLMAALVPTVLKMRRNADRDRTKLDLQAVTQALDAYRQAFNDYPRAFDPEYVGGPRRVLGRYLLGFDPQTDAVDGLGVRLVNNSGRKWGPYLPLDKFKVTGLGGLEDRYGSEIQYYPKWKEYNLRNTDEVLVTPFGGTPKRAMFNAKDGLAESHAMHLEHLQYMLGDGGDSRDSGNQPDNKINNGEKLTFSGSFILVSIGPDKVWGITANETKRNKSDDIYNFER